MSNKEFFHFVGGITISNSDINIWCDDVRNHMLDGHDHYNIASGDTEVTARRYENGQIDVCVANSCGHSRVSFYNEKPISIDLPNQVNCKIESTDAALKGQTVSSSYKPAILDNGLSIQVPPFIEAGDEVVVDTRNLEYVKKI